MTSRCGYVAIAGAPNAGKSTLVNMIVGAKVSIVSPKVQTTRTRVLGIAVSGESQIVLVDTPGLFAPRRRLDRAMLASAQEGIREADLNILIVDASGRDPAGRAQEILPHFESCRRPLVLVLNKIDAVKREKLLALASALNGMRPFAATFMISAKNGDGVADLVRFIENNLPEGPWLFPEDQITDMPMRLLAAEITREKLFLQLHEELPYALTVETESWEERADGSTMIGQVVIVGRDSHKGMVLGKGGARIKSVGEAARRELEDILEGRVHLKLFVKVDEGWADKAEHLAPWSLDPSA